MTVEAPEAPQVDGSRAGDAIGPGQWVTVTGLGRQGRVLTAVSQQGTVEVELSVGRVHLPVTALEPATAPGKSREHVPLLIERAEAISPEINLVGCTVEESTGRLQKYLDAAFVAGLRQIRVIHGKGTGTLRRGVHTFLAEHPLVEGFHLAEMHDGGSGATIVAMRER